MDRLLAIEAFVRLVELDSFSAVAAELRVAQPTISKWIAALEEEVGAPLMERTTRHKRLTEAGALLYEQGRAMLGAWDEATAQIALRGQQLRGRLRVSLPVVFGARYLVPVIAALSEAHPALEIEASLSDRYTNLIEEGIDVAIRVGRPADSTLRAITLAATPRRLVAAPAYIAARGAPLTPADLAHHDCLLHAGLSVGDVWSFTRDGVAHSAPVRGRLAINHSAALLELALRGLGVALLADWLVADALRSGALIALLPGYALPSAPIQALLPPGHLTHPRVRLFIDAARDHLRASLLPEDAPK